MAKSKMRISLAEVPPGMVRVRTRLGDHLRKRRGTHKPATLNSALKEATTLILTANNAARLFKNAIDPYRKELIDTTLWQRLVAIFRRQQTEFGRVDFSQLAPFDFHTRYTLHKIVPTTVTANWDQETNAVHATISGMGAVDFRTPKLDGYKLSVIVLFPDLESNTAAIAVQDSGLRSLNDDWSTFEVTLPVPKEAKCFVLCLRIDGYAGDKKHPTIASKGMKVLAAGKIGDK